MKTKENSNLVKKVIIGSLIVGAALTIGDGMCSRDTKNLTSTYQGYRADSSEGKNYLVFDDVHKDYRIPGSEDLIIEGNPDTLEIGKEYTIEYLIPRWGKTSPNRKKILDIKNYNPSH